MMCTNDTEGKVFFMAKQMIQRKGFSLQQRFLLCKKLPSCFKAMPIKCQCMYFDRPSINDIVTKSLVREHQAVKKMRETVMWTELGDSTNYYHM